MTANGIPVETRDDDANSYQLGQLAAKVKIIWAGLIFAIVTAIGSCAGIAAELYHRGELDGSTEQRLRSIESDLTELRHVLEPRDHK